MDLPTGATDDEPTRALTGTPATLSDTERAVLGDLSTALVLSLFDGFTRDHLARSIDHVTFRAGRIKVVWGVRLTDGRDVVIKAHRRPVDVPAVVAATRAMDLLVAAWFPCPQQLAGPSRWPGTSWWPRRG
ncbi:hypothetical protein GTR02_21640 [Kineococcus sp. R8]|uniref:hypothetical protein n=1 Tax=Kineococcus siccus TaxID=2696567 RepID=UPI001412CC0D|nr:hypothetical protein [Kineococcus siccus]NAZ84407.1 hypothetical protein [Kineococcus siccus]